MNGEVKCTWCNKDLTLKEAAEITFQMMEVYDKLPYPKMKFKAWIKGLRIE